MNVIMIVDVVTTVIIAVVIRRVMVVVGGISCCLSAYPASAKLDYTQQLHRHIYYRCIHAQDGVAHGIH